MSGGRAVHRLVERLALLGLGVLGAERGGRQHAERAGQHGGDVGQHVAEQVVGDDHVILLGPAHELHGAIVGQDMFERGAWILGLVHGAHHLVPQDARLHDVALVGRRHLVAASCREIEGDAGDAGDLVRRVELRVDGALLAALQRDDLLGLAEIDAAGQFAHDDDVEAFHHLPLERGGVGERRIADGGPADWRRGRDPSAGAAARLPDDARRRPCPISARRRRRTAPRPPPARGPWRPR